MEIIQANIVGSGLQVEGIPDAAQVIQLTGPIAQRLADLALHRVDLQFAVDSLAAVNPMGIISPFHREAMWRSAIVHLLKCFGDHEARFSLQPRQVYRGEPPEAIENFEYFKGLRDKHLVHDENSYAQTCLVPC